jgi:hypothetical protein
MQTKITGMDDLKLESCYKGMSNQNKAYDMFWRQ